MANYLVNELSDCYATISYFDIYGNPYVPTSVFWRLWDATNKVQLQDWTPVSGLAQSNTFDIPAALNVLGNPANLQEIRQVIFRIVAPGGAQRYDQQVYILMAIPDIP